MGQLWELSGGWGLSDRNPSPDDSLTATVLGEYLWNVTASLQSQIDAQEALGWMILSPDALARNGDNTRWAALHRPLAFSPELAVDFVVPDSDGDGVSDACDTGTMSTSGELNPPLQLTGTDLVYQGNAAGFGRMIHPELPEMDEERCVEHAATPTPTPPAPVGGLFKLQPEAPSNSRAGSVGLFHIVLALAGATAVSACGWYARTRWLR
jgi:hypothetical protein